MSKQDLGKRDLSETDICDRYITPALHAAGWTKPRIHREYGFTDGQMIVRGQMAGRGARKRVDYLLDYQPNLRIAVIEAKDNTHSIRAGLQQAIAYATALDVPFVFSSNGDGFVLHDRSQTYPQVEQEFSLESGVC